jgi:hypothetical protein
MFSGLPRGILLEQAFSFPDARWWAQRRGTIFQRTFTIRATTMKPRTLNMKFSDKKSNGRSPATSGVIGRVCRLAMLVLILAWAGPSMAGTKPRVINTTDLGADVDDRESMVHVMVTANEYDLEGIIGGTSRSIPGKPGTT